MYNMNILQLSETNRIIHKTQFELLLLSMLYLTLQNISVYKSLDQREKRLGDFFELAKTLNTVHQIPIHTINCM